MASLFSWFSGGVSAAYTAVTGAANYVVDTAVSVVSNAIVSLVGDPDEDEFGEFGEEYYDGWLRQWTGSNKLYTYSGSGEGEYYDGWLRQWTGSSEPYVYDNFEVEDEYFRSLYPDQFVRLPQSVYYDDEDEEDDDIWLDFWLGGAELEQPPYLEDDDAIRTASAFDNFFNVYTIYNQLGIDDPRDFFRYCRETVRRRLDFHRSTRVFFQLFLMYENNEVEGPIERVFNVRSTTYTPSDDFDRVYNSVVRAMLEEIQRFDDNSSGYTFVGVNRLEFNTAVYLPLRGGGTFIETPNAVKRRQATTNVKNTDNKCFRWAVARALDPERVEHANRASQKLWEYSKQYNWSMFEEEDYPMKYSNRKIRTFEQANELRVNIVSFKPDGGFTPLRVSKESYERVVTLLLIGDKDNYHYITVNNFNKLMSGSNGGGKHWCEYCFLPSKTKAKLAKHVEMCSTNKPCRVTFPKKGQNIKSFRNWAKGYRHPIVGYADFESFLKNVEAEKQKGRRYEYHVPSGSCLYFVSPHTSDFDYAPISHIVLEDSEDAAKVFVDTLLEETRRIHTRLNAIAAIDRKLGSRRRQDTRFEPPDENCHLCHQPVSRAKDTENGATEDWDIFTGEYYGLGHKDCVNKRRKPCFIPIFMHNLTGYDSHLFVKQLAEADSGEVGAIPKTDEKYISFSKEVITTLTDGRTGAERTTKIELRFLDSYRFLASSLDRLVGLLKDEECVHLAKFRKDRAFWFSRRKGVFPYRFMKSVASLAEKKLPNRKFFHSFLGGTKCSKKDYHFAVQLFNWLGGDMRAYQDFYQVNDVLQLADVFEHFRTQCINDYGLDPAYYYTTPGLADDACMKMSGVELELITEENKDMYLMFEKGIRGGVSTVRCKYARANNRYLDDYDPTKDDGFCVYWDMNALYSGAMTCKLPVGNFRWAKDDELRAWRSNPGIYEVDLKYPTELHDSHNCYPLAPERMVLEDGVEKLVPNLNDKERYVIHHEALKTVLKYGLMLTGIHRGILFDERDYAAVYINYNTGRREVCELTGDHFGVSHYKMMNNAYFGKTMENKRLHSNVKITNDLETIKKLMNEIGCIKTVLFGERLVAVHMEKTDILLDKPIYVGQAILDLSKVHMYDFHYGYVKRKWGEKAKLLMTDTDSLMYHIETPDLYQDIKYDVTARFDTSNYTDKSNKVVEPGKNRKKLRMMKDEYAGVPIVEFSGLRAKSYSVLGKEYPEEPKADEFPGMYEDNLTEEEAHELRSLDKKSEQKKSKGVQRSVVRHKFTHEDFKRCALEGRTYTATTRRFASEYHDVYTEKIDKIALCRKDNKCVLKPNGIDTYAIGHIDLRPRRVRPRVVRRT